jgi:hypothetical protein
MSESSRRWGLTILAAHSGRWSERVVTEFRDGVSSLLEDVEGQLRSEHPSLRLQPLYLATGRPGVSQSDFGKPFAFAILDITDYDEELAFLAGRMQGARIPFVFVRRREAGTVTLPRGLSDTLMIPYDGSADLFRNDSILHAQISLAISRARVLDELVYELWFPRDTRTIWVVCPQDHDPGEFADRSSAEYTYLDNLGDTDALLEIMVFLSRYYPNASIQEFSSTDLPRDHTMNNLVVIGGPGSCEDISNQLCEEMMHSMKSRVSYTPDCEQMLVTLDGGEQRELQAELRSDTADPARPDSFNVRRDYGYFARFPNPLHQGTTVVLINGIHTAGVRGAARAFADRGEALRNFHFVFNSGANPKSFECYFEVVVLNGDPRVPTISADSIYTLGPIRQAITNALDEAGEGRIAVERHGVTVLFIAGDRGGSQQSQAQTPREYDSIRDAIQGSKFRDAFDVANPILGATSKKLTAAYRSRAAILHFAGHGNDRSLSFILDQGLLVSSTPVSGEQLAAIVGSFPDRVRLCIFNTCSSASVAKNLIDTHVVEAAVGWSGKLDDAAAITFSGVLYRCLGDGLTLSSSVTLAAESCGSAEPPVLYTAEGVDATAFTFVERARE